MTNQHSSSEPAGYHVGVILVHRGRHHSGLGVHSYRALPRIGETLEFEDERQQAQAYRVVAVFHPQAPTEAAADIYVVHLGTTTDVLKGLGTEGVR